MSIRSRHSAPLPAAALVVTLLSACGGSEQGGLANSEVSVVLFLVDTLRADHLGCYGYGRDTSPELDALAAKSLLFERCLAQSTWTRPSTASIHTGLYPSQHGVNVLGSIVHEEFDTLAEILQRNEFRTAAFGYNPHVFADRVGFDQGFERFEELLSPDAVEGADPFLMEYGARAPRIVDAALGWLDEIGDQRSFLYLHLIDAHMPYQPPPPFDTKFRDGGEIPEHDVWDLTKRYDEVSPEERQLVTDLYDGEIAALDQELGRFLRGLEERGRMENTLFLFISDHGEEFGDHGHFGHSHGKMFDEITRVPFVMHVPGLDAEWRGRTIDKLVQQIDLLPTVIDALGLELPEGLPGSSVLTQELDPAANPGTVGISEAQGPKSYRKAVFLDNTKYVRTWFPVAGEELFDLSADPQERVNLLEGNADAALRHRLALRRHILSTPGRYRFDIENTGSEPLRLEGAIYADGARLAEIQLRDEDPDDGPYGARPIDVDGVEVDAFCFTFQLEPGDHDGLVFTPPPHAPRVAIIPLVNGNPAQPERILVGTSKNPTAVPVVLLMSDAEAHLAAPDVDYAWENGPYRIRVWRMVDHEAPETEFSAEVMSALEALGYAGDD